MCPTTIATNSRSLRPASAAADADANSKSAPASEHAGNMQMQNSSQLVLDSDLSG